MLLKDDKKRMVTLIMKKLNGSSDFDQMRSSNEEYSETPMSKDGAELDNADAKSAAAKDVMTAMENKDPMAFKASLTELIRMCMEEYESDDD